MKITSKIKHGDCRVILKKYKKHFDSCVCDPPYHLTTKAGNKKGFMQKHWDGGSVAFDKKTWKIIYKSLKPGAFMLVFGGTRTFHRMACAIEDAGFEIRDCISWVYGSGFPKSLNISKAIDNHYKQERKVVGTNIRRSVEKAKANGITTYGNFGYGVERITVPSHKKAKQWDGWGTTLKPAWEPIIVVRKPIKGNNAQNIIKYGTGGINIDSCRIPYENSTNAATNPLYRVKNGYKTKVGNDTKSTSFSIKKKGGNITANSLGRWPANFIHDGSDEVMELFPSTSGKNKKPYSYKGKTYQVEGFIKNNAPQAPSNYANFDSAARFFYCSKANKTDRQGSKHPTVKPISLIRYLVRLITPETGIVLDPFAGSGSLLPAAYYENRNCFLIEQELDYIKDIKQRKIILKTKKVKEMLVKFEG